MPSCLRIIEIFSGGLAAILVTKCVAVVRIKRIEKVIDQQANFHLLGKILLDFIIANEVGKGEWI
jgi:hypothetical protein